MKRSASLSRLCCMGLCTLLGNLCGLLGATQWVAHTLSYQPALGPAWVVLGGWPLYVPYRFVLWYLRYGSAAPQAFARPLMLVYGGALSGVLLALLVTARSRRN